MGVEIGVVEADNNRAIETAFATLVRTRVEALLIGTDPFLFSRRVQLATLATRHAIPAAFSAREFPEVGGLMSYGTSLTEVFRQLGVYVGRILNGAKPADLPVVRSVTFELVINMSTARALDLRRQPIDLIVGPAIFDRHVLAFDIAGVLQALAECAQTVPERVRRCAAEESDPRDRLLPARREWPDNRRAADQRDELAPVHSITSAMRTHALAL
jgi:hypothetical protein